jgi:hypothetical protein
MLREALVCRSGRPASPISRGSGEDEPRLVAADVVGDEVGVVGGGVAWGGNRPDLRVAELDDLAVGERVVREIDPGALRQIRRGARAGDELGQAGDVVRLHMRLEHRDDRHPLLLGERDVVIDEIGVRIGDGERALGLAAEQVGGAGRVVVQELAEEHHRTVRRRRACA